MSDDGVAATTADPVRIVLADDHARVRAQVRQALEAGGMEVCGEAATAEEALALTLEQVPDVALLDIHMPGNGISAADEITKRLPQTAVVMLTRSSEDDDLFDSLRAGACGYLLKGSEPAELATALRAVLANGSAMSPQLVSRVLQEFRAPRRRPFVRKSVAAGRLSTREWEVMDLLGQGLTTDEVAKRLFLSPTTVRVHVSTVLRKLRVKDREAAFRVLREDPADAGPGRPGR
ncbi:response regulator [Ornithinimicrobium pekingense]|uniref:DNA-binding response regulator n=1 Tax=Ornithinimicrobium pekingense TaxID=384677 RepID=A0ABQ2F8Q2_9MICO|nr:response regulator transcription factor [Ornithinimicrobium pekingense]GGK68518.1 DNA-binding response regulator [Ornithinimicrobium pekingense]